MTNFIKKLVEREISSNRLYPNFFVDSCKMGSVYYTNVRFHSSSVNAIDFSEDGNFFISGGEDCVVKLWKINDLFFEKKSVAAVMDEAHVRNVFCLSISPDNSRIYSSGLDESNVKIHDTCT